MKKNKLVHVITNLEVGGAQTVLYAIIQAGRAEYDHEVIYFRAGPFVERFKELDIPTHHVQGLLFRYDIIFLIRLYRALCVIQPNVIHSLLWAANVSTRIISFFTTIPLVTVYHNNVDQDGMIRSLLDQMSLLLFKGPIVAVSPGVKQALVKRTQWPVTRASIVIANGIDVQWVQEQANAQRVERAQFGLSPDDYVIGAVGRLCPVKNYYFLIEIFSKILMRYPGARLMIIGSGPEELKLRTLVAGYGIAQKVIFVGQKPAYGYYELFDCFVQTSREGISMALLEAMSLKIPAVVVTSDDEHAVIRHGINGLIMPTDTSCHAANTIEQLIADRAMAIKLGMCGQQDVLERFSREKMYSLYDALFERMVEQ